MKHIALLLLDLFLSSIIAYLGILCESHKVVFREHPDFGNPEKMPAAITSNQKYISLLKEYRLLIQNFPRCGSITIGKCSVFFLTFILFFGISYVVWPHSAILTIAGAVLPVVFTGTMITYANKTFVSYRNFLYNGSGQRTFPIILSSFYGEMEKYCYIEESKYVDSKKDDLDFVLYLMEKRVNAVQRLIHKSFDHTKHWLIFAVVFASTLCLFQFGLNFNWITCLK